MQGQQGATRGNGNGRHRLPHVHHTPRGAAAPPPHVSRTHTGWWPGQNGGSLVIQPSPEKRNVVTCVGGGSGRGQRNHTRELQSWHRYCREAPHPPPTQAVTASKPLPSGSYKLPSLSHRAGFLPRSSSFTTTTEPETKPYRKHQQVFQTARPPRPTTWNSSTSTTTAAPSAAPRPTATPRPVRLAVRYVLPSFLSRPSHL